jgi:TM2 domain-containing membrane protein YozV
MFCSKCGNELEAGASFCSKCGASVNANQIPDFAEEYTPKSSTGTALLAMFAGLFGIHDFYVGKTQIGIAKVVLAFFGIFAFRPILLVSLIWQLIDVIRIAAGSYSDGKGHPIESGLWTVVYTTIAVIILAIIPIIIIRIMIAQ